MKIGNKIRRIRKLKGLTIEELADKAGITKGFISQLERDLTVPSVTTLKQVLDVLGVELSSFFSDFSEREKFIYTTKERTIEKSGRNFIFENLIPRLKYLEMEPKLLTLKPMADFQLHFEEDEGFGFVVRGNLQVKLNHEEKRMNRGDCFYMFFDNRLTLKNLSNKNAEVLMVNY
ncbi:MAG: helix-turn-helix transcriptional regulator [Calditrichaeota bacterium]|nr:helix-turn-helix transcriptional regulator [Calditrichota bacterium]